MITKELISDRQIEIIEASVKILTRSGISGFTIKNLAKEMQFSESAIYIDILPAKEEIIVAMLDYLANDMDIRYMRITNSDFDAEQKFKMIFENQFSFFEKNPHFVVAVFSDGLMEESVKINETILKIMSVKMKHLMPIISDGQHKNVFTNAITTEELIHIVMGTFRLLMFKWRVANFQFDIIRNGNNMVQSLLTIIKN